ncbi:DNA polymerase III subunit gamma/tau, partial [Streptomyces sp. NPDC127079]
AGGGRPPPATGGGKGPGGHGAGRSGGGGGKGFGPGGGGGGGGNDPHQDGVTSPVPTGFAPLAPDQPVSLPAPTYSAL